MKTCLQEKYGLFINGQWQPASDGKTFKSYNPANGELLAECAQATDADLDLAVDSAWKAWDSWKQTTPAERAKILNRIADIIDENAEHLAMVETLDNGNRFVRQWQLIFLIRLNISDILQVLFWLKKEGLLCWMAIQ